MFNDGELVTICRVWPWAAEMSAWLDWLYCRHWGDMSRRPPNGKALGPLVSRRASVRFPAVRLSFSTLPAKRVVCRQCLVTDSIVCASQLMTETLKWLSSLPHLSSMHCLVCVCVCVCACARVLVRPDRTAVSAVTIKPVLNWANVCSLNILWTVRLTNYDSFLIWTFSSPNMVRTVRRTLLRSHTAPELWKMALIAAQLNAESL